MNNFIVLDTETGGLDETKNPITEIAIVVIDGDTLEILEEYSTYVKPYNNLKYDQKALDYTKITMDDINSGIEAKQVVSDVIDIFKRYKVGRNAKGLPIIVAHNGAFDIKFIFYLFDLYKEFLYKYTKLFYHDTMEMSQLKWPHLQSITLGKCCNEAGVELVAAHKAINDTRATVKLFKVLIGSLRGGSAKENVIISNPMHQFREAFKFNF